MTSYVVWFLKIESTHNCSAKLWYGMYTYVVGQSRILSPPSTHLSEYLHLSNKLNYRQPNSNHPNLPPTPPQHPHLLHLSLTFNSLHTQTMTPHKLNPPKRTPTRLPGLCTCQYEGEPVDAEMPPQIGGFVERYRFQFRAGNFWVVT